jgi:hypothetical protein
MVKLLESGATWAVALEQPSPSTLRWLIQLEFGGADCNSWPVTTIWINKTIEKKMKPIITYPRLGIV